MTFSVPVPPLCRDVMPGIGLSELDLVRRLQSLGEPGLTLAEFVYAAWPVVVPEKLQWSWHMQVICDHLQAQLERGRFGRAKCLRQVMNVPPGTSKPCHVESMVNTRRGYIRLADVQVGDEVLTHQGRFRRVTAVHDQGVLPMLEVSTWRGRKLRLADDHPLLTTRGWVRADELTTADTLAVVHPTETSGASMPREEARLLGYLIGDGGLTTNQAIFTNADPETLADFKVCAASMGFTHSEVPVRNTTIVKLKGGAGDLSGKWRGSARVGVYGPVQAWLQSHGLRRANSYTKRVPARVLCADEKAIADFVAAYWACDGGISDRRDLPRSGRVGQKLNVVRIDATTVSEGLARDMQHLLARLGMSFSLRHKVSKLKTKRQGDLYHSWMVVADNQDTAARFMQIIGPRIRHEKRLRAAGLVRTAFDSVLSSDPVLSIARIAPGECRCLTVAEDHSFTIEDIAVHNSLLQNVFAPAWMWLWDPSWSVICASANPRIVLRDSVKCREVITSGWYQNTFRPVWKLADDQNAKGSFKNTKGGSRVAFGAGSSKITGEHASALFFDDLLDASEATNKTTRDSMNDWLASAAGNRLNDLANDTATMIAQRLHENDPPGYVLAKGDWEHLVIPMEYEIDRPCKCPSCKRGHTFIGWVDPRTVEGEVLDPKRFPPEVLAAEMTRLGPSGYAGQMQQRPSAADGNMFRPNWWRFYTRDKREHPRPKGATTLPAKFIPMTFPFRTVIQSWDMSFKELVSSDRVCGGVLAANGADIYVLDLFWDVAGFTRTIEAVKKMRSDWPKSRLILIEDKANGTAAVEVLQKQIRGVVAIEPKGGKEARAAAMVPTVEAGNIYLPEGAPWLDAWFHEFNGFPLGRNDDAVDMLAQAVARLEGSVDSARAAALLGQRG